MSKRKENYKGLFRSESGVWFVRFRNGNTDRIKTTGKTDFDEAVAEWKKMRAEAQLELTVDDRMDQILTQLSNMPDEKRREATRLHLITKLQGASARRVLISAAWAEWLKIPKTTGAATLAGYSAVWKQFTLWLSTELPSYTCLDQITAHDAKTYSKHLWKSNITGRTYNLHCGFLTRFWNELETEAGLSENVWKKIKKQAKNTVSHDALTREQLTNVIRQADGELKGMLLVGLLSSLRLKDVVFLNASNFHEAEGVLKVQPFKTRRLNKPPLTIPVHPQLLPILKKPGKDGFFFPETAKAYRAQSTGVSKAIQQHFEKCGVRTTEAIENGVQRKREAVKIGFHSLRFSFVSICANKGTPQHVLSELVGHSSPSMTLHYSQSNGQQRTKAIGKMPTIDI